MPRGKTRQGEEQGMGKVIGKEHSKARCGRTSLVSQRKNQEASGKR